MNPTSAPAAANPAGRVSRAPRPALFISVIVPVRNEGRFIAQTLRQLLAQDYPTDAFEILVIDGQSTDDTVAVVQQLAQEYDCIRCHANPLRLSSAGRNLGIRHARGDVVLIVDGHCEIPNDRMLANVARAFDESGADCLGRPQPLDTTGASPLQRAIAAARSSRLGHHPESFIYSSRPQFVPAHSVAVAYRRDVFDRVGHFDETFDAHEDGEFNYRCDQAGLRCYFTPDIAVKYHPRDTLSGLFGQMIRYGRGRARFLRKHPKTISPGTLAPAILVAWLCLWFLVGAFWSKAILIGVGTLLVYVALLCFGAGVVVARSGEARLLPLLPIVWMTTHGGAALGMFAEWTRGIRRRRDNSHDGQSPRVLLVAASLRIMGGQAVMAQQLATELRRDGVDVDFLPVNPKVPRWLRPLTRVKYLRTLVNSAFYLRSLIGQIPRHDVVHVFSASYMSFLISPAPAVLLSRLFRKPVILNYHSGEAEDHLRRSGCLTRWLLALADSIVVPSAYLKSIFERFGFQASAIANHVDTSRIRFRERVVVRPRILVPRALEPLYNVGCAIRAFGLVKQEFPAAELTILGEGSQRRSLERLVQEIAVCNVTFAGRVEREDIFACYDDHDIVLNTSSLDNMPVSLIEAFAAGLPVVTTRAGGIPCMVRDGENGFLVDLDDYRSAAQRVIELLNRPDEALRVARTAREDLQKYSWSMVGSQWRDLYHSLAERAIVKPSEAPVSPIESS